MATLKEQLAQNSQNTLKNVDKGEDRKDRLAAARAGLVQAIALQMLIDQYGENESFEAHLNDHQKLVEETIPNDPDTVGEIQKVTALKKVLKYTDDPKQFMTSVQEEKEAQVIRLNVMNELKKLADQGDYKGMVDYTMQIAAHNDDPQFLEKLSGITKYFSELCNPRELTKEESKNRALLLNPPVSDKAAAIVKGFVEEFTSQMAKCSMEGIKLTQKQEQDIRSGKYAETLLVNDDPRIPRKLSEQMMFNQTEPGLLLRGSDLIAEAVFNASKGAGFIDNMPIGQYFPKPGGTP